MLQFPEMKSITKHRGFINTITKTQDTFVGKMDIGAIFSTGTKNYEPSFLGSVPSTGTSVYFADNQILNSLLTGFPKTISVLGNFYESETLLPLTFPHFGQGVDGIGDAYHSGVYGITGSGKSTLAKLIVSCYTKHPEMAIVILDPVGEFTRAVKGERGAEKFFVDLRKICENHGKRIESFGIENLVLDRWELLPTIIKKSDFLNQFTITSPQKQQLAAEKISAGLVNNVNLNQLNSIDTLETVLTTLRDEMPTIYSPGKRLTDIMAEIDGYLGDRGRLQNLFDNHWSRIGELYTPATTRQGIWSVLTRALDTKQERRPVLVINLDEQTVPENMDWDDEIRAMIILSILRAMVELGIQAYRSGKTLNTLLVVDEAQRLVPKEAEELGTQQKILRGKIKDAVETVRKFGIGIMFISTSLSTLHPEVYRQNRISFYGFGLNYGSELLTLQQKVSDNSALKLYQSFRDPHTAFTDDDREYSFMTIGPCSPLSFSGKPLFLTMFNNEKKFLESNGMDKNKTDPLKEKSKPTLIPS